MMDQIAEAIANLETILNEQLKKEGGLPYTYKMEFEPGKVYARIVRGEIWTGNTDKPGEVVNRSCFGFIKLDDLTLWKSAGWKAPAKNKARGVLDDLSNPAKVLPRWRYSIS